MDCLGFRLSSINWPVEDYLKFKPTVKDYWFDAADFWGGALGYGDKKLARKYFESCLAKIKEEKPNVIIGDLGIEPKVAGHILGIPFISITQGGYHPNAYKGRLRWWEEAPQKTHNYFEIMNEVLSEMHVPTISKYEDLFLGDYTIIPSFEEFDRLEVVPEKTIYTGPILWNGNFGRENNVESIKEKNGRTAFMYTGRLSDYAGDSGAFLLFNTIKYLADNNINTIISNGGLDKDCEEMLRKEKITTNVEVVDWVPIEEAYSKADIVIHHGGHGSSVGGFVYGTPAVVIPTHSEREYNGRAVEQLGAGKMIMPKELTKDSFIKSIDEVLNNKVYAEKANYWRNQLKDRNYGGHILCADLIESLC